MKKLVFSLIVTTVLLTSVVLASSTNSNRYYVFSENPALKLIFGVRHDFPGIFSTELNSMQLGILKSFGVRVEKVPIYHITPPNKCGDGVCQGFESPETCPEDCGSAECYPDNQYPWGIVKVNGGSGGSGIIVAVLDTGVDQDHPDLINSIIDCVAFGYTTCEDGNGHGTHVSGTILANGKIIGVAPEANLMAVKVCSDSGSCYGDDIADGINYATNNGANIISMSLGGDSPDPVIKSAIDYAVNNSVLIVAAAGNDGPSEGSIDYPGAYAEVIAVGAIDSNESVPSFSSRGINDGDDSTISEGEIEFGAPGVDVESTYNDGCYAYASGTSMATPHVSGLAAKLWKGTALDTRLYLRSIAKDIYTTGYDTATGYGLPIAPGCLTNEDCSNGEICCSGQCVIPTCSNNTDCDDSESCTTDTCENPGACDAYCSNTWPACGLSDGCCGPECNSINDPDCVTGCGNGICEGSGEDCFTCPEDCRCVGSNCFNGCCGNGICEKTENTNNCLIDCA